MTADKIPAEVLVKKVFPDEVIQRWCAAIWSASNTREYENFRANILAALTDAILAKYQEAK